MTRVDGRKSDQLRPVEIVRNFQPAAYASVLIRMGKTHVLCAATLEEKVPPFLRDTGQGWITAEYGMLPCATGTRTNREAIKGRGGRTYEIQRLIGRALRMVVDLRHLGERTLRLDCDVLNADGGTRTAAITGASLALKDALDRMLEEKIITAAVPVTPVAAVSAGIVDGLPLLDLCYVEDCRADADANFVLTADGRLVEAQCTAESRPLTREEFTAVFALAEQGISDLFALCRGAG